MIVVLAAVLFSFYFVKVAMIPNKIKQLFKLHPGARLKPFDCVTCLSVWSAAGFYFLPSEITLFTAIIFGAGFIGTFFK